MYPGLLINPTLNASTLRSLQQQRDMMDKMSGNAQIVKFGLGLDSPADQATQEYAGINKKFADLYGTSHLPYSPPPQMFSPSELGNTSRLTDWYGRPLRRPQQQQQFSDEG